LASFHQYTLIGLGARDFDVGPIPQTRSKLALSPVSGRLMRITIC
jgi:hypothetical protein